jgi:hypothetical protein
MKKLWKYTIVILIIFMACGCEKQSKKEVRETSITVAKGEINVLPNGDCVIKFKGQQSVLKNVKTFIMFNNDPYFELDDGKIMRWNVVLSDDALNLQKIWDELYFIKQFGDDAGLGGVFLNRIDKNGKLHEIKLMQNGNFVITDNYGVFNDKYIIEDSERGLCIARKNGKVIACYPWPK